MRQRLVCVVPSLNERQRNQYLSTLAFHLHHVDAEKLTVFVDGLDVDKRDKLVAHMDAEWSQKVEIVTRWEVDLSQLLATADGLVVAGSKGLELLSQHVESANTEDDIIFIDVAQPAAMSNSLMKLAWQLSNNHPARAITSRHLFDLFVRNYRPAPAAYRTRTNNQQPKTADRHSRERNQRPKHIH